MNIKQVIQLFFILCPLLLQAQDKSAAKYVDAINAAVLREDLTILASDALEGRETGSRGQKMAAAFIKAHFESLGLSGPVNGDYNQPVTLYTSIPGEIYLRSGERRFVNFEDVVYYGAAESDGEVSASLVFAGNGSEEEMKDLDLAGKCVLIKLQNEGGFREPIAAAREKNARMVLLYNEDEKAFLDLRNQFRSYLSGGTLSLKKPEKSAGGGQGVFFISESVASALMNTTAEKLRAATADNAKKNALKKIKPATVDFKTEMVVKTLKSDNVLGYLEGSDKKEELIIITAHYDHIGMNKSGTGDIINNGADDDGSGTVGVMALATAFSQAKENGDGPRRSILFMTVTGEEKGLLGSDYYTQNPVFPLEKTMVNLNIDMVGRRDPQHKDSAPYVYVIGSDKLSTQLHEISERVNRENLNLEFDYTYNDQNHPDRLYYRSDHWNFAKNNIPIIFYFDGIHEDYHKPSDEVDKIEFDLLEKRIRTVYFTAWELANMDQRIVPDVEGN